jgi:hypothetical protein
MYVLQFKRVLNFKRYFVSQICVFEGAGDLIMDSLAMFIFLLCLFVLLLLYLGKFLYYKYVKKIETVTTETKVVTVPAPVAQKSAEKLRSSEPREISEKKIVKVREKKSVNVKRRSFLGFFSNLLTSQCLGKILELP